MNVDLGTKGHATTTISSIEDTKEDSAASAAAERRGGMALTVSFAHTGQQLQADPASFAS
jgi:hypothetical protein